MTWSFCDAVPVDVAAPMTTGPLVNVENPVTVRSVKVLGAAAIADSIVAVVVASSEAIFLSCLAELIT